MTTALSSISGFLSLLDPEEVNSNKEFALNNLNYLVDQFWHEISDNIPLLETIYHQEDFPTRKLAALIISKTYYHLGKLSKSMHYALRTGDLFDVTIKSEYTETLIAKCIDEYVRLRVHNLKNPESPLDIESDLEAIVEKMFERSFNDGEYKHSIGISLQARRLDKLEEALRASGDISELLKYTTSICLEHVPIDFRPEVLRRLVLLYEELETPDYLNVSRCLVFLDDSEGVAKMLEKLVRKESEKDVLLAYQIAFELCDNATQQFLKKVRDHIGNDPSQSKNISRLRNILTNEPTIDLFLQFLYKQNRSDLGILKAMKSSFDQKNSILHNATITANAIMHCGTTRDVFLKDNLEWLKRATNWAKFSVTAGLGVIHKGHLKESMKVLVFYLPESGNTSSPYSEGGSLYALGIIHANHGDSMTSKGLTISEYLLNQIKENGANEVILHGAALGIGIADMATGKLEVYDELVNMIYSNDNAVAGEAAGYAIGLVMLGQVPENVGEILNFAHDTQHEKIIRGISIGLALMYYGKEEEADSMIEQLLSDKDAILRYGGVFMIGMAYGGTSNNFAIRKLLHTAVSDVNDDVRRAAVMNLGFILFRQPEQIPKLVSLLSESYNPSVRYGACLAIGIGCAGTGLKEAYDLLIKMAKDDLVDTVRQGAMIALAMVFIQVSDSRAQEVRKLFKERFEDRHESVMAKLGAILAYGIIDAGGRNVTLSLRSKAGHKIMQAMVGMAIFLQYWYWFPLSHFISLAFTPTGILGLNKDLKMPKFKFTSNAPPSRYAYPPDIKPPETKKEIKVTKVELAATKRSKRGLKSSSRKSDKMEVEDETQKKDETKKEESNNNMEVEGENNKGTEETKEQKKKEPSFEILENPARVTRSQINYISFSDSERYVPVTEGSYGIVMLQDRNPGEKEEIIDTGVPEIEEDLEPEPPEAFKFTG